MSEPKTYEEFGPEQVKAELLAKAIDGVDSINAAINAGVLSGLIFDHRITMLSISKEHGFLFFSVEPLQ